MTRWWVISDDFPPQIGGVSTWSEAVALGLSGAGHDVRVITRHRGTLAHPTLQVRGLRGPSFGRRGGRWVGVHLRSRLRAGDRVLATTWPVSTGIVSTCRRLCIPIDVVAHGSDITRAPVDESGLRSVLSDGRWWAVSRYLAGEVRSLGPDCRVLPCPIDPRECFASTGTRRWIHVGRATPLKGGDRAIRLAAAAGVHLDVVGDGTALASWSALAEQLSGSVRFWGSLSRSRALELMAGAELALLLPRSALDGSGAEGLGLVAVEAASLCVPTVGCRTGGVPEAIGPGLLLDDPDNVVDSIRSISEWWTLTRGAEARSHLIDHHGVHRVIAMLEAA